MNQIGDYVVLCPLEDLLYAVGDDGVGGSFAPVVSDRLVQQGFHDGFRIVDFDSALAVAVVPSFAFFLVRVVFLAELFYFVAREPDEFREFSGAQN